MTHSSILDHADVVEQNAFPSHPGYDEAYGPRVLYDFFGGEIEYIPLDEVAEEDDPLRFVVGGAENPEDCERRLYFVDPDEPLGRGQTMADLLAELEAQRPCITIDPDYVPAPTPIRIACRHFTTQEVLPAVAGIVTVSIRTFDKKIRKGHRRWFSMKSSVTVSVRKTRTRH